MPLPGFEPGSPGPQSISTDLDRSAMGPALKCSIVMNRLLTLNLVIVYKPHLANTEREYTILLLGFNRALSIHVCTLK